MSDFSKTMKDLLSRSVKFIGRTFHSAASETKYKANELSLNNKRRELIHELGKKVLELSAAGHVLPAEANEIISQINKLDGDMNVLRNDHAAKKAAAAEQYAMEKAARATEKAAAQAAAAIEKGTASVEVEPPVVEVNAEVTDDKPVAPALELDIEEAVEEVNKNEVPTLNI